VSVSFFGQCTTRTVQESKLFPVNPYICLSYYNAWYRYPELLRKVDAALPAEEIGVLLRQNGLARGKFHPYGLVTAALVLAFLIKPMRRMMESRSQ